MMAERNLKHVGAETEAMQSADGRRRRRNRDSAFTPEKAIEAWAWFGEQQPKAPFSVNTHVEEGDLTSVPEAYFYLIVEAAIGCECRSWSNYIEAQTGEKIHPQKLERMLQCSLKKIHRFGGTRKESLNWEWGAAIYDGFEVAVARELRAKPYLAEDFS
jgi:hypothetical protein